MARRKWTQDDLATVVRMWRSGSTLREIAQVFGVSSANIGARIQQMRSVGVDLPRRNGGGVDVDALNNL